MNVWPFAWASTLAAVLIAPLFNQLGLRWRWAWLFGAALAAAAGITAYSAQSNL